MTDYRIIWDISRTHLISRFKQSGIAALGVALGIGAFIILMSFMTGLNGMLDGLVLNRTPHIHIYNEIEPSEVQPVDLAEAYRNTVNVIRSIKPKQSQDRIHNALPLIAQLEQDDRVLGVTPQAGVNVFYLAGSIQLNGMVSGIQVMDQVRLFNFSDYIVKGSPEALVKNNNGILLGAGVANKLSVGVGDRIQLSTVQGGVFPLKIVGIFQSGMADFDNVQSYVNLKTAQQLLGEGSNYISDINVKLYDMEQAPSLAKEVRELFDIAAMDIKSVNAQFDAGTSIRNIITYAVSFTLLLVAGFGIYNILNMLIYEKMNDIAILKATGFSGPDVQKVFLLQAMVIGLIGGLLGLLLGFGVSVLIDNTPFETAALPTIKTYPVNFQWSFNVVGIVFAMISTFLAGYLPARKAQRIDPVEIIRGQ